MTNLLIKYLDYRNSLYGCITGKQTLSSNYYKIGNVIIRISDHIKYGQMGVTAFDYCFIIQPNDMYIFTSSPKLQNDNKMYLKIVTYHEAKEFIKKLHDFAVQANNMMDIYHPDNWNKCNMPETEKPSWSVFYETYMKSQQEIVQMNILDKIERMCKGSNSKGNLTTKLNKAPDIYKELTIVQVDKIIETLEAKSS